MWFRVLGTASRKAINDISEFNQTDFTIPDGDVLTYCRWRRTIAIEEESILYLGDDNPQPTHPFSDSCRRRVRRMQKSQCWSVIPSLTYEVKV